MGAEIGTVDTWRPPYTHPAAKQCDFNWRPNVAKIKTGIYTGDGNDNRTINIDIDLEAKNNVWVIVKSLSAISSGVHRIEYGQGDLSMRMAESADEDDIIQSFVATGFQIGANAHVNSNTVVYRYIVHWEEP